MGQEGSNLTIGFMAFRVYAVARLRDVRFDRVKYFVLKFVSS